MIDFHSHILPFIDDGAKDIETSVKMLMMQKRQGVNTVFATPHFYAYENSPEEFLENRENSFKQLKPFLTSCKGLVPSVRMGAEIYCYPGMSESEQLKLMVLHGTNILLLEPPMEPWSDSLLDEMAQTGNNLNLRICCAHVDRYMRILNDFNLIYRLKERGFLVQFNAKAFLDDSFAKYGLQFFSSGQIDMLGTDSHNITDRTPNMAYALSVIFKSGLNDCFKDFLSRTYSFFT